MAKKEKFIKYKEKDGSVTLTRRDGPYDEGANANYKDSVNELFRGVGGSAKASTIKAFKHRANDAAEVLRDATKKARNKNDESYKFLEHKTIKGK